MLTQEKLDIYRRFRGDVDSWARSSRTDPAHRLITDDDWMVIEELINRLRLQNTGLTSEGFDAKTDSLLLQSAANPTVQQELRAIAFADRRKGY